MSVKSFFAGLALSLSTLSAATAADTITLLVGYSPGGSYDSMARLVAEHLPRHLEGSPEIIVENAPGAGSLKLARIMAKGGQDDDTRMATVSSALALRPIFDPEADDFDPRKVHYIAATSSSASYCVVSKSSGITSFEQLLNDPEAKIGATGRSSTTYTYPTAIKAALDGKFTVVTGFKGGSEINLAMERGEIDARCGMGASAIIGTAFGENVNVVGEMSTSERSVFDTTTFILGLAPEGKRDALALVFASGNIHRPLIMSPGASEEAVARMRAGMAALATDQVFLDAATALGDDLDIRAGDAMMELLNGYLGADPAVAEMARQLVQ